MNLHVVILVSLLFIDTTTFPCFHFIEKVRRLWCLRSSSQVVRMRASPLLDKHTFDEVLPDIIRIQKAYRAHRARSFPFIAKKLHQLCPICHEEEVLLFKTVCAHSFHEQCLKPWIDKRSVCPMCRTVLPKIAWTQQNK